MFILTAVYLVKYLATLITYSANVFYIKDETKFFPMHLDGILDDFLDTEPLSFNGYGQHCDGRASSSTARLQPPLLQPDQYRHRPAPFTTLSNKANIQHPFLGV